MENNDDIENSDNRKRTYEQHASLTNPQSNSVSNNDTATDNEHPTSNVNNTTDTTESVQNAIEETPEILDLSITTREIDPINVSTEENIIISYDNFDEDSDVDILVDFVRLFGLNIVHEDENATILVVKTYSTGYFFRSGKVGNWLVANRPIVTFQWVTESLESNSLLSFHHYMPIDYTGEQSPLASWRFGRGITYSRNEWTKQCMLFFHSSCKYHEVYPYIQNWAKTLGFLVTESFENFKQENLFLRIILVEDNDDLDEEGAPLPKKNQIFEWMYDYKALTVNVSWFLDCVFQYKFVEITKNYIPTPIPVKVAERTGVISYYKREEEED